MSNPAPITEVHKLDTTPLVQLILLRDHKPVGSILSPSRELAALLERAAQLDDWQVMKCADQSLLLGQDIYNVSRAYVLAVRGAFTNWPWKDLEDLERVLPSDIECVCIVSY